MANTHGAQSVEVCKAIMAIRDTLNSSVHGHLEVAGRWRVTGDRECEHCNPNPVRVMAWHVFRAADLADDLVGRGITPDHARPLMHVWHNEIIELQKQADKLAQIEGDPRV